jgi:alkylation response protein AidB-like acyl-CoA dehydrogenase
VILVERSEGVETTPIKTSYVRMSVGSSIQIDGVTAPLIPCQQSPSAGTSFVTFDNVQVPVENTLGAEGSGMFVMLRYVPHTVYVYIFG